MDGSASELEDSSSIGIIIRDCNGHTVAAYCKPLESHFPAELVEVFAVEQGLLLARELQLSRVMLESDALSVINAINDSSFGAYYGHIIQDISLAQYPLISTLLSTSTGPLTLQLMNWLNLPVGMAM